MLVNGELTWCQRDDNLVGSWWTHVKTDNVYVITAHCLIEATTEEAVVYRQVTYGGKPDILWCRPLDEFLDGRFIRRNSQYVE